MGISQYPSGRWKAQCRWNGASYHVGMFVTREAAEAAMTEEYANLRAGTSVHLLGTATLTTKDYSARIQVREGTVKRWIHEGMPVRRSDQQRGTLVRIDPVEADAWVAQHHAKSVSFARDALVYVVQRDRDDAVKIGWANDIEQRLRELRKIEQCAVCLVAAVPGDKVLEQAAHRCLAEHRLDGEWFAVTPEAAYAAVRSAA